VTDTEVFLRGGFATSPIRHGCIFDDSCGVLPSRLLGFDRSGDASFGSETSTCFGIVKDEAVFLEYADRTWGALGEGYYFSVPGQFRLRGTGRAAIFERIGFRGTFLMGGPIESHGRLAYIDGCTDSILVPPPRAGDPCMNGLWFPKGVKQTMHFHPTVRMALVLSGEGCCVTPDGEIPLRRGYVFLLREMSAHCFHTCESSMSLVTYHPDSDWGPTDANHPLINRTLIPQRP